MDFTGLSVHASFFDFDKDGDLDCYLLSNSIRSVGGYDLIEDQRNIPSKEGNKFLVNEKRFRNRFSKEQIETYFQSLIKNQSNNTHTLCEFMVG